MQQKNNIIILGAGLSGLYSAFLLQELGYEVLVLEARDRVGGRTFTLNDVDLGGQWVSSLHPRVMKLCERFSLSLYRQFEEGLHISFLNNNRTLIKEKPNVKTTVDDADSTAPYIQLLYDLMNQPDFVHDPSHLDKISVYQWYQENIPSEAARKVLLWSFDVNTCADPRQTSLYFWLYYLKTCGGYRNLVKIKDGAQEFRIQGGSQMLSLKLSENLQVVYNAEVTQVLKRNELFHIITADNKEYLADKVISTIPLQLVPKIKWTPSLEADRIRFYKSMKMGCVTKVVLQYELAFWRQSGYSGQIISDSPPIYLVYDACNSEYNALVVFIVNDSGYSENQILDQLAFLLGNDLAKTPKKIDRKNWTEDLLSGGCYFCVPPVDSFYDNKRYLTMPVNGIYFAGTETATIWMGYMEGALESAERTVAQLNELYIQ